MMMMMSNQEEPQTQEGCQIDPSLADVWVETTDEDGHVHYFERIDELEVEGKEYVVLIYHGKEGEEKQAQEGDDAGHDEEIVLMRLIRHEDGDEFVQIEDDEEFEKVLSVIEGLQDGEPVEVTEGE
ncbi:MAG: DUF1292 domain-containing protein [Vampirovibrionales bacterium]